MAAHASLLAALSNRSKALVLHQLLLQLHILPHDAVTIGSELDDSLVLRSNVLPQSRVLPTQRSRPVLLGGVVHRIHVPVDAGRDQAGIHLVPLHPRILQLDVLLGELLEHVPAQRRHVPVEAAVVVLVVSAGAQEVGQGAGGAGDVLGRGGAGALVGVGDEVHGADAVGGAGDTGEGGQGGQDARRPLRRVVAERAALVLPHVDVGGPVGREDADGLAAA